MRRVERVRAIERRERRSAVWLSNARQYRYQRAWGLCREDTAAAVAAPVGVCAALDQ